VGRNSHLSLVHSRDSHTHRGTCQRCGHTETAIGYQAAKQAIDQHWNDKHREPQQSPADRWPWRGMPNRTQLFLLQLAAREELIGYLCRVHWVDTNTNVDVGSIMSNPRMSLAAEWRWYPSGINGWQRNYLPGLIAARLILSPKFPAEPDPTTQGTYRITPAGRAVLHNIQEGNHA